MSGRTVIAVGTHTPVYEGRATYFDAFRPVPREVTLRLDDETGHLLIEGAGDAPIRWAYGSLRARRDQAGAGDGLILCRAGGDPARLMLDARDTSLIRARAHRLYRRSRPVRWRRIAVAGLAALASVALMVAVLRPDLSELWPRIGTRLIDGPADSVRLAGLGGPWRAPCAMPDAHFPCRGGGAPETLTGA